MSTVRRVTIGGKPVNAAPERLVIPLLGNELMTVIEKSQRLGYLESVIPKQLIWLRENPDHELRRERDRVYWDRVRERNQLVADIQQCGVRFSGFMRELEDQTVKELGEVIGGQLNDQTMDQISRIARRDVGAKLFQVLDRWSREHYMRTTEEQGDYGL